jgi:hypothetical protein
LKPLIKELEVNQSKRIKIAVKAEKLLESILQLSFVKKKALNLTTYFKFKED